MEPGYHQLEFEVRVYLTHLETSGARLWNQEGEAQELRNGLSKSDSPL